MDNPTRRLINVEKIIDERFSGNKSRFADAIGKNASYVHRWFMKEGDRRNISNATARQIEETLKLPKSWLDNDHDNTDDLEIDFTKRTLMKADRGATYLPSLLGSTLIDTQYQLSIINNKKGKLMIFSTDGEAYGFQFLGHNPNPILSNGWGLIVEPNTPLTVDEFALIRLKTGEILLRTVAYLGNDEMIVRHPVTGDQSKFLRSQIERAEYCYVGTPPSKIIVENTL